MMLFQHRMAEFGIELEYGEPPNFRSAEGPPSLKDYPSIAGVPMHAMMPVKIAQVDVTGKSANGLLAEIEFPVPQDHLIILTTAFLFLGAGAGGSRTLNIGLTDTQGASSNSIFDAETAENPGVFFGLPAGWSPAAPYLTITQAGSGGTPADISGGLFLAGYIVPLPS